MRNYGLPSESFLMNDNLAQNYTFFCPILELNHIFKRHKTNYIHSHYLVCSVDYWKIVFFMRIQFFIVPRIFSWRQISWRVWLARHWNLQNSFQHHLLQNVRSRYNSSQNRQGIYYLYKKAFDNHFKAVNIQKFNWIREARRIFLW